MPWLAKQFYPWADGIVAVSQGVGDDLAQFVDLNGKPIHVIYNPVVRPELHDLARLPLDHPWFRPGEPPVVLGVGRLNPQKDFGTLIRAFAKVVRTREARLLILGEGAQRDELEALVKELNLQQQISLPGFANDVYAYMSRASLFVLSSKWEGLPGVLIEAMCCGAPVVSTDCPSGPREILQDGKYGDLVPMDDADALADAIATNLDAGSTGPPRESWRRFEPETVVDQYLEVLLGTC
jgi:glycosyltransferase involved in cell wall biosynthesis